MAFTTVKLRFFIHFLLYVYLICFYINLSINLCLSFFVFSIQISFQPLIKLLFISVYQKIYICKKKHECVIYCELNM